jgi:hypothetical protein
MLSQVRVMLCDKDGNLLPPSECRLLLPWAHAWLVPLRLVVLVQPSTNLLPYDAATVAACKAEAIKWMSPGIKEDADLRAKLCWDFVGKQEVVLEGGLHQVHGFQKAIPG